MPEQIFRINGRAVAEFRRFGRLSQRDLAQKIKRSPGWVAQVELGQLNPSEEMVEAIAAVLRVDVRAITPAAPEEVA